ncbi:hypothetical protein NVP1063O_136 [Vibrio phage 1.063.O._10N.261.45.C7]|nr:hypothetical protein NVP1063O_136 [Vibrio phage 1.063.O._10N.261.45.C7]
MFTPTEKDGIIYYSELFHENYNYRNHTDTSVEVFVVGKGGKLAGYRYRFNMEQKLRSGGDVHVYAERVRQSMVKTLSKELIKESLLKSIPLNIEDLYYNQSEYLVDWLPTLEVVTDEEGNSKVRVKI